jgi:hypothetical protein
VAASAALFIAALACTAIGKYAPKEYLSIDPDRNISILALDSEELFFGVIDLTHLDQMGSKASESALRRTCLYEATPILRDLLAERREWVQLATSPDILAGDAGFLVKGAQVLNSNVLRVRYWIIPYIRAASANRSAFGFFFETNDYGTLIRIPMRKLVGTLGGMVLLAATLLYLKKRRIRRSNGRCRYCGYDLRFNQSGICPECGTAIPEGQKAAVAASANV